MSAATTKERQSLDLPRIFTVRGKKVVLDSDLARLYAVPTKRLNEAVGRNTSRFPEDFYFVVSMEEDAILRSQYSTSGKGRGGEGLRSQIATLKKPDTPKIGFHPGSR